MSTDDQLAEDLAHLPHRSSLPTEVAAAVASEIWTQLCSRISHMNNKFGVSKSKVKNFVFYRASFNRRWSYVTVTSAIFLYNLDKSQYLSNLKGRLKNYLHLQR